MTEFQTAILNEAAVYGCLILTGQEQPFLDIQSNMHSAFRPEAGYQTDLFREALQARWTLRRCIMAELHLHSTQPEKFFDPLLDDNNDKTYRRIARMKRDSQRAYDKAIKQLAAVQTEIRFRLQTFPPEVKELGRDQAPHNFSILVDTNKVLQGALKTNRSTTVEPIESPLAAAAEDLVKTMVTQMAEDTNPTDTAAVA